MKKLLLLLAFISTTIVSNAQQKPARMTGDANTRAAKLTETMTRELTLTPEQQKKVAAINLTRTTAMDANREKSSSNPQVFGAEKMRIVEKWNNDLKAVLTPEQQLKLKKYQQSHKGEGKK
jgi:Spy/CpxP family protein refolding chaperone